jgi:hypothetical protein
VEGTITCPSQRSRRVGIAQLDNQAAGVQFPVGARDISVLHNAQTGSHTRAAFYATCNEGCCFPGGNATGARSWPLIV